MNHFKNDQPPGMALAFFRWFCHPEFREDIEGDLLERFHKRLTKTGVRKAKWLFVKDVLLLFRPGIIIHRNSPSQQKIIHMKTVHWKKLTGLNLLVALMIVSPFIPGPSNKLVQVLSFAGQITGIFGLLLVPVGLAWTIIEIRKSAKTNDKDISQKSYYHLASTATLLIAFILLLGMLLVPNPMPKMSFFFALLLVLSGFILAVRQIRKWKDKNEGATDHGASVILAVSATACITFICIFTLVFVFMIIGIIPGIFGLLLLVTGLIWAIKQIRKLKGANERKFNRLPLYLLSIPLIAFLTLTFIREPASNFSRSFAIKRSAALIASIEGYKNRTGQYTESIQYLYASSVNNKPAPFIMGIEDFRYNKINDHYSLSFSQWPELGLEEIVLYDKNNLKNNLTGEFAKYDYSFDLCRAKGAFSSHATRYDNWRYYLID